MGRSFAKLLFAPLITILVLNQGFSRAIIKKGSERIALLSNTNQGKYHNDPRIFQRSINNELDSTSFHYSKIPRTIDYRYKKLRDENVLDDFETFADNEDTNDESFSGYEDIHQNSGENDKDSNKSTVNNSLKHGLDNTNNGSFDSNLTRNYKGFVIKYNDKFTSAESRSNSSSNETKGQEFKGNAYDLSKIKITEALKHPNTGQDDKENNKKNSMSNEESTIHRKSSSGEDLNDGISSSGSQDKDSEQYDEGDNNNNNDDDDNERDSSISKSNKLKNSTKTNNKQSKLGADRYDADENQDKKPTNTPSSDDEESDPVIQNEIGSTIARKTSHGNEEGLEDFSGQTSKDSGDSDINSENDEDETISTVQKAKNTGSDNEDGKSEGTIDNTHAQFSSSSKNANEENSTTISKNETISGLSKVGSSEEDIFNEEIKMQNKQDEEEIVQPEIGNKKLRKVKLKDGKSSNNLKPDLTDLGKKEEKIFNGEIKAQNKQDKEEIKQPKLQYRKLHKTKFHNKNNNSNSKESDLSRLGNSEEDIFKEEIKAQNRQDEEEIRQPELGRKKIHKMKLHDHNSSDSKGSGISELANSEEDISNGEVKTQNNQDEEEMKRPELGTEKLKKIKLHDNNSSDSKDSQLSGLGQSEEDVFSGEIKAQNKQDEEEIRQPELGRKNIQKIKIPDSHRSNNKDSHLSNIGQSEEEVFSGEIKAQNKQDEEEIRQTELGIKTLQKMKVHDNHRSNAHDSQLSGLGQSEEDVFSGEIQAQNRQDEEEIRQPELGLKKVPKIKLRDNNSSDSKGSGLSELGNSEEDIFNGEVKAQNKQDEEEIKQPEPGRQKLQKIKLRDNNSSDSKGSGLSELGNSEEDIFNGEVKAQNKQDEEEIKQPEPGRQKLQKIKLRDNNSSDSKGSGLSELGNSEEDIFNGEVKAQNKQDEEEIKQPEPGRQKLQKIKLRDNNSSDSKGSGLSELGNSEEDIFNGEVKAQNKQDEEEIKQPEPGRQKLQKIKLRDNNSSDSKGSGLSEIGNSEEDIFNGEVNAQNRQDEEEIRQPELGRKKLQNIKLHDSNSSDSNDSHLSGLGQSEEEVFSGEIKAQNKQDEEEIRQPELGRKKLQRIKLKDGSSSSKSNVGPTSLEKSQKEVLGGKIKNPDDYESSANTEENISGEGVSSSGSSPLVTKVTKLKTEGANHEDMDDNGSLTEDENNSGESADLTTTYKPPIPSPQENTGTPTISWSTSSQRQQTENMANSKQNVDEKNDNDKEEEFATVKPTETSITMPSDDKHVKGSDSSEKETSGDKLEKNKNTTEEQTSVSSTSSGASHGNDDDDDDNDDNEKEGRVKDNTANNQNATTAHIPMSTLNRTTSGPNRDSNINNNDNSDDDDDDEEEKDQAKNSSTNVLNATTTPIPMSTLNPTTSGPNRDSNINNNDDSDDDDDDDDDDEEKKDQAKNSSTNDLNATTTPIPMSTLNLTTNGHNRDSNINNNDNSDDDDDDEEEKDQAKNSSTNDLNATTTPIPMSTLNPTTSGLNRDSNINNNDNSDDDDDDEEEKDQAKNSSTNVLNATTTPIPMSTLNLTTNGHNRDSNINNNDDSDDDDDDEEEKDQAKNSSINDLNATTTPTPMTTSIKITSGPNRDNNDDDESNDDDDDDDDDDDGKDNDYHGNENNNANSKPTTATVTTATTMKETAGMTATATPTIAVTTTETTTTELPLPTITTSTSTKVRSPNRILTTEETDVENDPSSNTTTASANTIASLSAISSTSKSGSTDVSSGQYNGDNFENQGYSGNEGESSSHENTVTTTISNAPSESSSSVSSSSISLASKSSPKSSSSPFTGYQKKRKKEKDTVTSGSAQGSADEDEEEEDKKDSTSSLTTDLSANKISTTEHKEEQSENNNRKEIHDYETEEDLSGDIEEATSANIPVQPATSSTPVGNLQSQHPQETQSEKENKETENSNNTDDDEEGNWSGADENAATTGKLGQTQTSSSTTNPISMSAAQNIKLEKEDKEAEAHNKVVNNKDGYLTSANDKAVTTNTPTHTVTLSSTHPSTTSTTPSLQDTQFGTENKERMESTKEVDKDEDETFSGGRSLTSIPTKVVSSSITTSPIATSSLQETQSAKENREQTESSGEDDEEESLSLSGEGDNINVTSIPTQNRIVPQTTTSNTRLALKTNQTQTGQTTKQQDGTAKVVEESNKNKEEKLSVGNKVIISPTQPSSPVSTNSKPATVPTAKGKHVQLEHVRKGSASNVNNEEEEDEDVSVEDVKVTTTASPSKASSSTATAPVYPSPLTLNNKQDHSRDQKEEETKSDNGKDYGNKEETTTSKKLKPSSSSGEDNISEENTSDKDMSVSGDHEKEETTNNDGENNDKKETSTINKPLNLKTLDSSGEDDNNEENASDNDITSVSSDNENNFTNTTAMPSTTFSSTITVKMVPTTSATVTASKNEEATNKDESSSNSNRESSENKEVSTAEITSTAPTTSTTTAKYKNINKNNGDLIKQKDGKQEISATTQTSSSHLTLSTTATPERQQGEDAQDQNYNKGDNDYEESSSQQNSSSTEGSTVVENEHSNTEQEDRDNEIKEDSYEIQEGSTIQPTSLPVATKTLSVNEQDNNDNNTTNNANADNSANINNNTQNNNNTHNNSNNENNKKIGKQYNTGDQENNATQPKLNPTVSTTTADEKLEKENKKASTNQSTEEESEKTGSNEVEDRHKESEEISTNQSTDEESENSGSKEVEDKHKESEEMSTNQSTDEEFENSGSNKIEERNKNKNSTDSNNEEFESFKEDNKGNLESSANEGNTENDKSESSKEENNQNSKVHTLPTPTQSTIPPENRKSKELSRIDSSHEAKANRNNGNKGNTETGVLTTAKPPQPTQITSSGTDQSTVDKNNENEEESTAESLTATKPTTSTMTQPTQKSTNGIDEITVNENNENKEESIEEKFISTAIPTKSTITQPTQKSTNGIDESTVNENNENEEGSTEEEEFISTAIPTKSTITKPTQKSTYGINESSVNENNENEEGSTEDEFISTAIPTKSTITQPTKKSTYGIKESRVNEKNENKEGSTEEEFISSAIPTKSTIAQPTPSATSQPGVNENKDNEEGSNEEETISTAKPSTVPRPTQMITSKVDSNEENKEEPEDEEEEEEEEEEEVIHTAKPTRSTLPPEDAKTNEDNDINNANKSKNKGNLPDISNRKDGKDEDQDTEDNISSFSGETNENSGNQEEQSGEFQKSDFHNVRASPAPKGTGKQEQENNGSVDGLSEEISNQRWKGLNSSGAIQSSLNENERNNNEANKTDSSTISKGKLNITNVSSSVRVGSGTSESSKISVSEKNRLVSSKQNQSHNSGENASGASETTVSEKNTGVNSKQNQSDNSGGNASGANETTVSEKNASTISSNVGDESQDGFSKNDHELKSSGVNKSSGEKKENKITSETIVGESNSSGIESNVVSSVNGSGSGLSSIESSASGSGKNIVDETTKEAIDEIDIGSSLTENEGVNPPTKIKDDDSKPKQNKTKSMETVDMKKENEVTSIASSPKPKLNKNFTSELNDTKSDSSFQSSINVYKPIKNVKVHKAKESGQQAESNFSFNTIKTNKASSSKTSGQFQKAKTDSSYNEGKSVRLQQSEHKTQNTLPNRNASDLHVYTKRPQYSTDEETKRNTSTNIKVNDTTTSNQPGIILLADPKFKHHLHKLKRLFGKYMPVSVITKINDIKRNNNKIGKNLNITNQQVPHNNSVTGNLTQPKLSNERTSAVHWKQINISGNARPKKISEKIKNNTARTSSADYTNDKGIMIKNNSKYNHSKNEDFLHVIRPELPGNQTQRPMKETPMKAVSKLGIFGNMSAITGNKNKIKVHLKMKQLSTSRKINNNSSNAHWTNKLAGNKDKKEKQELPKTYDNKNNTVKLAKKINSSNKVKSNNSSDFVGKNQKPRDKAPSKGGGFSALSYSGLLGTPHKSSKKKNPTKKKPSPKSSSNMGSNYPYNPTMYQTQPTGWNQYNYKKPKATKSKPQNQQQQQGTWNSYPTSYQTQSPNWKQYNYKKPKATKSKPKYQQQQQGTWNSYPTSYQSQPTGWNQYNYNKPKATKSKPKSQQQQQQAWSPTSRVTAAQNNKTPYSSSWYKQPTSPINPKKPVNQKATNQAQQNTGYKSPYAGTNSQGGYNNYNYNYPSQYGNGWYNQYTGYQQGKQTNKASPAKTSNNNAAAYKQQQYYSKQYPGYYPYAGYNSGYAGNRQGSSQRLNEKPSEVSKPGEESKPSEASKPSVQSKPALPPVPLRPLYPQSQSRQPMLSQASYPYMAMSPKPVLPLMSQTSTYTGTNGQSWNPQVMSPQAPVQLMGVTSPMYKVNNYAQAGYPSYPMFIASPSAQTQSFYNYGTQNSPPSSSLPSYAQVSPNPTYNNNNNPTYTYQTTNPSGGYVIYDSYELSPNDQGMDCSSQDDPLPEECNFQMPQGDVTQSSSKPIVMKSASKQKQTITQESPNASPSNETVESYQQFMNKNANNSNGSPEPVVTINIEKVKQDSPERTEDSQADEISNELDAQTDTDDVDEDAPPEVEYSAAQNDTTQQGSEHWTEKMQNTQDEEQPPEKQANAEAQYSSNQNEETQETPAAQSKPVLPIAAQNVNQNDVTQATTITESKPYAPQLPIKPKNPFDIRNLMKLSEGNIEHVLKALDKIEHYYASRRKNGPAQINPTTTAFQEPNKPYGDSVAFSAENQVNPTQPTKKIEYYVNDDMFDPNGNTPVAQSENQEDLTSNYANQANVPYYSKKESPNQQAIQAVPGKDTTNNAEVSQDEDLTENSDEHIFFKESDGSKSANDNSMKVLQKVESNEKTTVNQGQNNNNEYDNRIAPPNRIDWYPSYEVNLINDKESNMKANHDQQDAKTPFKTQKHAKENFFLDLHKGKSPSTPFKDYLMNMKVKIINGLPEMLSTKGEPIESNGADYSNSLGRTPSTLETQQHFSTPFADGNSGQILQNPYIIEEQSSKDVTNSHPDNYNPGFETDLTSFEKTETGKKIVGLKEMLTQKLAMMKAKKKPKLTSNIEKFLNKDHKDHFKALGDLQESFDNPNKQGGVSYFGAASLAKILEGTDDGLESKIVSLTGKTREKMWPLTPTPSSTDRYSPDIGDSEPTKSATPGPTYSHYKQRTGLFGFVAKDTEMKCSAIGKTDFQDACPRGWVAHVEFCYGIFEEPEKSWKAFPRKCAEHNGILAMPKTEEQLGFLRSHLRDRGLLDKEFHIGLHRSHHQWRWIDDNEFNMDSSYNDLYGRTYHDINCGTFYKGHVRSTKCSKAMPYICEIKRGMEAVHILAFGDSLTRGYYGGGKEHHPYTEKLEYLLNTDSHKCFLVDNQGKDKELAAHMTKRLDKFLQKAPAWYKWIVILAGTNDIVHDRHPATEKNWDRIVHDIIMAHQTAHKYGFNTIVVTIPEIDCEQTSRPDCMKLHKERLYVNERLRHYAMETSAAVLSDLAWLLPRYALDTEKRMFFWEPGLHMKPQGYDRMAEIIYKDIVRNLK